MNDVRVNKCLVNGEWVTAKSGKTIEVINPFDQQVIDEVPSLSRAEVEEAIFSASTAFESWKNTPVKYRSKYLLNWFIAISEHGQTIARIISQEQGKPLAEAEGEVKYAASYAEFYAQEILRSGDEQLETPLERTEVIIVREPIGVVGIITPWNFPIAMMVRKVAPALASGCTCVVKPDEQTPLSALLVIKLLLDTGIDKGVVNIVTGNPVEIGEVMTKSSLVRKISFTGSTNVGKWLYEHSADTLKKLTLELGGNASLIVFKDADIEKAVASLVYGKFRNAGQTCVAVNRVYVHDDIKKDFIEKLSAAMTLLKVGNPLEGADIGPLINEIALAKVERLVSQAIDSGAKLLMGGKRLAIGTLYSPTILDDVTETMDLYKEEVFGPVVSISAFSSVEEVVSKANDTVYGLANYIFSSNSELCDKVSRQLECGMVGVNTTTISSSHVPFGGIKHSGFGREGGKYGLEEYLTIKYINKHL